MQAIKEHLDYISREGELELENDRGEEIRGREALAGLALEWQYGGGLIPAVSHRRAAFNWRHYADHPRLHYGDH
jgi:hypothetical protein